MAEQKSQSSFPYIAIVALVAVVGIVVVVLNGFPTSSGESQAVEEDVAVEGVEEEIDDGALAGQAAGASTCTDSDGGKNYFLKGTSTLILSGGSYPLTDSCSSGKLVEYYCNSAPAGTRGSQRVRCPARTICAEGACAPICGDGVKIAGEVCDDGNTNPLIVPTDTCSRDCKGEDTDGGLSYTRAGICTDSTGTYADVCFNSTHLNEFSFVGNSCIGYSEIVTPIRCATVRLDDHSVCRNGACS